MVISASMALCEESYVDQFCLAVPEAILPKSERANQLIGK